MLNIQPLTKQDLTSKYLDVSLDFLTDIRDSIVKKFQKFEQEHTTIEERCWENAFTVVYDSKAKANILTIRYITWDNTDKEEFIEKLSHYFTMNVAHFWDILPNVIFKVKSKKEDSYDLYAYKMIRRNPILLKL